MTVANDPAGFMHPKAKIATAYAEISFREAGLHRWKDAPERRAYLRDLHRHCFHVSVRVKVDHDDRQVEFHDLLDGCQAEFRRIVAEADGSSCETMARRLLSYVYSVWGVEEARVSVAEDGEVAGIVGSAI